MIESFQYINKAFESKVRLGIMAVLMVNEEADFNFLREQLALTDGNLASHTQPLLPVSCLTVNPKRQDRVFSAGSPIGHYGIFHFRCWQAVLCVFLS